MGTPPRRFAWEHVFGVLGIVLFGLGARQGLLIAAPDRFMGDVMRILYVHVPAAWTTLLLFTVVLVASVGWLWKGTWGWDWVSEAATRTGIFFGALLLATGSLWARPTWGVWWDWDPRLTTVAVMMIAFSAIMALRSFVEDPQQRATWAAVSGILAYVSVPIVYFSVRWWRSLHQTQSSPSTVDPDMVLGLRLNAFAYLFFGIWFLVRTWRLIKLERARDAEVPV